MSHSPHSAVQSTSCLIQSITTTILCCLFLCLTDCAPNQKATNRRPHLIHTAHPPCPPLIPFTHKPTPLTLALTPIPTLTPQVHNEGGSKRVVVTKALPGDRWLQILTAADCRVEVSQHPDIIQDNTTIKKLIGSKCDGVIGQLTEVRVCV